VVKSVTVLGKCCAIVDGDWAVFPKLIVALCTTTPFTFKYNYIQLLPLNPGPQVISII
jgi:hypothetical protein